MDYLVGHLIGDYLFQTDWQAQNKTWAKNQWRGLLVALYHAALWTLALCGCGWLIGFRYPVWMVLLLWVSHGLQDWTRFPTKLMEWRKQFVFFREQMPQAYAWATILVDNTFHLILLWVLREVIR